MKDRIAASITTHHANLDLLEKEIFAFSVITESIERDEYRNAADLISMKT